MPEAYFAARCRARERSSSTDFAGRSRVTSRSCSRVDAAQHQVGHGDFQSVGDAGAVSFEWERAQGEAARRRVSRSSYSGT